MIVMCHNYNHKYYWGYYIPYVTVDGTTKELSDNAVEIKDFKR